MRSSISSRKLLLLSQRPSMSARSFSESFSDAAASLPQSSDTDAVGEQKGTTIGLAGLSTRVRSPTLGGEVISPPGGHSMHWSWRDCHLASYPKESAGGLHLWLQA